MNKLNQLRDIMDQAQVFASAWSLVGGQFDKGQMLADAEGAKAALTAMVRDALVSTAVQQEAATPSVWVPVGERLPETGALVLVRAPATKEDWTADDRINLDFISEDWEDWCHHCESYEHYMAVGGSHACGPDAECVGPSEKAPYTHWMAIPEVPKAAT